MNHKRSVLVVDDCEAVRRALTSLLTEEGYQVRAAEDGEQGFRALCQSAVDLVLSDVVMPCVSGVELIGLIRRDPFLASLPIVAMSTYGSRPLVAAKQAGANAVIEKPFREHELLPLIARLIDAAGQAESHARTPLRARSSAIG